MVIVNTKENSLVSGSTGADSIVNKASYVTIDALGGNDTILSLDYLIAYGDDEVEGFSDFVSINGGTGNDIIYIENGGSLEDTIKGGKGNDSIDAYGSIIQFESGDGNDVVNFGDNLIQITDDSDVKFSVKGDDGILKIGTTIVTLKGTKDNLVEVQNADGESTYAYHADSGFVTDFLYNENGDEEANFIYLDFYDVNPEVSIAVDAGVGNDTIIGNYNGDVPVSINAGNGNDIFKQIGYFDSMVTINTGKGNDTIDISEEAQAFIQYKNGDGNDVIINTFSNIYNYFYGTIDLLDDTISSYEVNGNDHIFKIGEGSITIKNLGVGVFNPGFSVRTKINGEYDYKRLFDGKIFSNYSMFLDEQNDGSYNYSDKITNGTSEDDFINIDFYEYYDEELEDFVYKTMATVNADAGNDYIQDINWCSESFISGGNGNDTILSLASRKYPIRRFWR
ncbi:MAG: hypothetical protein IJ728_13190 [Selenomonadaceae bacterium]|nr:hypothetical protein [Selenomonadaceae bacterium]